jgi:lysyl-tRNA synthetase class 2
VLEVETPILSSAGNTDVNIESFSLDFPRHRRGRPAEALAAHFARVRAQAPARGLASATATNSGRVFRNGESGACTTPSSRCSEWYRIGWTTTS